MTENLEDVSLFSLSRCHYVGNLLMPQLYYRPENGTEFTPAYKTGRCVKTSHHKVVLDAPWLDTRESNNGDSHPATRYRTVRIVTSPKFIIDLCLN